MKKIIGNIVTIWYFLDALDSPGAAAATAAVRKIVAVKGIPKKKLKKMKNKAVAILDDHQDRELR